jgi:predicted phage tail component-like protein
VASYDFIYNGVNLSNLVRVRAVETTVLPPRENHAITIWERPGSIYNSYRYGERDIVVTFLIRATQQEYNSNPNCMENKLNTLRNVFKVTGPKPLYLGTTSRYILAVPEGDFKMTELRYDCYECEIQFVCHNPEYYSSSVKANKSSNNSSTYGMRNSFGNNTIEVYNSGNASAYPIINIGINDSTSFIQVENTTNGNKFLLGSYPVAGKDTYPKATIALHDNMSGDSVWGICGGSMAFIDNDRDYLSARITSTNDGSGQMLAGVTTSSSLWSGVGLHRSFISSVEQLVDFDLKAKLHLNSYGVNGDPTVPQYRDEGTSYQGTKEDYYKVVAPSVPIWAHKEIYNREILGTYNKGDEVHDVLSESNGWIETELGWCEAVYFKKYISDTESTDAAMNVVVITEEIELWSRPSDDPSESLLLATIPYSTPLRIHRGEENGYYKLYIPYNGKVGYITTDDKKVLVSYDVPVNYPEENIIVSDDNKTGICEVYGYSRTGEKLFKLCLSDDNPYYSYVTPTVYIGENKVLEEVTMSVSNNDNVIDDNNVAYDALSETTCDWNNFYGELGIRREDNKWQAWIYKIENGVPVKKIMLKEQEFGGVSEEPLYYLAIYMGTQDPNNMCGMAITDIQIDIIHNGNTPINPNEINPAPFNVGDEIKIDCYNNKVYLNNKLYNDIDIGSQFIELLSGNNILKFASEDPNMHATVLYNERYL